MDLYVFAQEATGAGLTALAAVDTVRVVIPTAGEYAAYAALEGTAPDVYAALGEIQEIEGVYGVDAYAALSSGSPPMPMLPMPMPTRVASQLYVCFALLTIDPGASAAVYSAIAANDLAAAATVVAGTGSLVLAELTADDPGDFAAALDLLGAIPEVREVASSVGPGPGD